MKCLLKAPETSTLFTAPMTPRSPRVKGELGPCQQCHPSGQPTQSWALILLKVVLDFRYWHLSWDPMDSQGSQRPVILTLKSALCLYSAGLQTTYEGPTVQLLERARNVCKVRVSIFCHTNTLVWGTWVSKSHSQQTTETTHPVYQLAFSESILQNRKVTDTNCSDLGQFFQKIKSNDLVRT